MCVFPWWVSIVRVVHDEGFAVLPFLYSYGRCRLVDLWTAFETTRCQDKTGESA